MKILSAIASQEPTRKERNEEPPIDKEEEDPWDYKVEKDIKEHKFPEVLTPKAKKVENVLENRAPPKQLSTTKRVVIAKELKIETRSKAGEPIGTKKENISVNRNNSNIKANTEKV